MENASRAQRPNFPLKLSADRRHLVDQDGIPFLLQGDTAWSIIAACTADEVGLYLRNRVAKGFNAIIINLVEYFFNGPLTRDGQHPFVNPEDISTLNEAYFTYADWVLKQAEEAGILVFLAPLYLGYANARNHEGWYEEVRRGGAAKSYQYGAAIGKRYRNYKNIIWMIGGDRNPDGVVNETISLVQGIKSGDPAALFTAHPHPDSVTVEHYGGTSQGGWLDIATTYTYQIVHDRLLNDYYRKPTMPFVLVESTYEGEHNSTPLQIRRQAYWALLRGACGQFLGNNPIWLFNPGWQAAMDLEGSRDMVHWHTFFASRPWYDLIPDQRVTEGWVTSDHTHFFLEGVGEFRGLDTLIAAHTADRNTLMAYLPTARDVTADLREISGNQVRVWWFNPRNGETHLAGVFSTAAPQQLTPPGPGDWGLIVDNAALDLPAPGK
jgi:hypothetical protein